MLNLEARRVVLFTAVALPGCDSPEEPPIGPGKGSPAGDEESSDIPEIDDSMCDELVPEGDAKGEIAADWSLENSRGDWVSLWDYCGAVIFFEEGAYW